MQDSPQRLIHKCLKSSLLICPQQSFYRFKMLISSGDFLLLQLHHLLHQHRRIYRHSRMRQTRKIRRQQFLLLRINRGHLSIVRMRQFLKTFLLRRIQGQ